MFDVNPYFFAMLIALNLQTSFLTPPMAMSAYYLKGVQKKNVELMEIFAGIMPIFGHSNICYVSYVYVSRYCLMVARNVICKLDKPNVKYFYTHSQQIG